MERNGELHLVIRVLRNAGIFVWFGSGNRGWLVVWWILCMIPYIVLYFVMLPVGVLQQVSLSVTILMLNICMVNNAFQVVFRSFYLNRNRRHIVRLLAMLRKTSKNRVLRGFEVEMRRSSAQSVRYLTVGLLVYYLSIWLFAVMLPFGVRIARVARCQVSGGQPEVCDGVVPFLLAGRLWWPHDVFALPDWYFMATFQCVINYVYFITIGTTDSFVCSLILAVSKRGAQLARTAPHVLRPPANLYLKLRPSCRAWIRQHQLYLQLVQQMNELVGPVALVTTFFSVFNIVSYIYVLAKYDDSSIFNLAVTAVAMQFIQIYMFAYCGQEIVNQDLELCRGVQRANETVHEWHPDEWLLGSTRSVLGVVAARCSGDQPEQLTAMGLYPISLSTFSTVVSASMSYMLVLNSLGCATLRQCRGSYESVNPNYVFNSTH